MKREVKTEGAPAPAGPYSQGIAAGPFVFVSGPGPRDPGTGELPDGIEAQTERCLRNVRAVLEAAGASMDQVVKVTAHLADLGQFAAFNSVYERHFGEPRPVRTTVQSGLRGLLVEVDVIAYVG